MADKPLSNTNPEGQGDSAFQVKRIKHEEAAQELHNDAYPKSHMRHSLASRGAHTMPFRDTEDKATKIPKHDSLPSLELTDSSHKKSGQDHRQDKMRDDTYMGAVGSGSEGMKHERKWLKEHPGVEPKPLLEQTALQDNKLVYAGTDGTTFSRQFSPAQPGNVTTEIYNNGNDMAKGRPDKIVRDEVDYNGVTKRDIELKHHGAGADLKVSQEITRGGIPHTTLVAIEPGEKVKVAAEYDYMHRIQSFTVTGEDGKSHEYVRNGRDYVNQDDGNFGQMTFRGKVTLDEKGLHVTRENGETAIYKPGELPKPGGY